MTLQFDLNHADPTTTSATDCTRACGIFADGALTTAGEAVDRASNGRLRALIARGDVSGKSGRTTLLHDLVRTSVAASRVLTLSAWARRPSSASRPTLRAIAMTAC